MLMSSIIYSILPVLQFFSCSKTCHRVIVLPCHHVIISSYLIPLKSSEIETRNCAGQYVGEFLRFRMSEMEEDDQLRRRQRHRQLTKKGAEFTLETKFNKREML